MSRFAAGTDVPVDRSQGEIQRTLLRYGATEYMFGQGVGCYYVAFNFKARAIRITIEAPPSNDRKYEGLNRQRFRCLLLIIKAKLEAVESGIVSVEQEFMPYLVMPDGRTVSEHTLPMIKASFASGKMPKSIFGDTGTRLLTEGKA